MTVNSIAYAPKRHRASHALRLFPSELERMIVSPWFAVPVVVCLVLVALSAILNHLSYSEWYGYAVQNPSKGYGMESRLMVSYWVGTDLKPSSVALYFLLPLLCLLPGAGSLVEERSSGYQQHALSRLTDRCYYGAKAFACFIAAGLVALVPLAASALAAALVAPYGAPDPISYVFLAVPISWLTPFRDLYFTQPLLFLAVWTLAAFLVSGIWATALLGVSLFVRNATKLFLWGFAAQLFVNYATVALSRLLAQDASRSLDLFTLLVPTGYEGVITSLEGMAASLVVYGGLTLLLPALFFKRRCYL